MRFKHTSTSVSLKFAIDNFETKYGSDMRFTLGQRTEWKMDASLKINDYNADLKAVNKRLMVAGAARADDLVRAKVSLTYNLERLKEVTHVSGAVH